MMPTTPAGTSVTFDIPPADLAELDELARASQRDTAALVAEAVAAYLDVQRWQVVHIQEGLRQAEAGEFATDAEVEAMFATFQ